MTSPIGTIGNDKLSSIVVEESTLSEILSKIFIRAISNKYHLAVPNGELREYNNTHSWETFKIIPKNSTTVAFKTHHGTYVKSPGTTTLQKYLSHSSGETSNTKFNLLIQNNNTVAIQSVIYNRYVRSPNKRSGNINQQSFIGGYELFKLGYKVGNSIIYDSVKVVEKIHPDGWIRINGQLKQISSSEDGNHLWGIAVNNTVHYRNGVRGYWRKISDNLKQIDVSADGNHIWGVNSNDIIYYRNGVSGSWTQVGPTGSSLKQISVSGDGSHVWGVNYNDMIYYRNGFSDNRWTNISGSLKQISVSGDGNHIWGVNNNDIIYYRNGRNGSWKQVA